MQFELCCPNIAFLIKDCFWSGANQPSSLPVSQIKRIPIECHPMTVMRMDDQQCAKRKFNFHPQLKSPRDQGKRATPEIVYWERVQRCRLQSGHRETCLMSFLTKERHFLLFMKLSFCSSSTSISSLFGWNSWLFCCCFHFLFAGKAKTILIRDIF